MLAVDAATGGLVVIPANTAPTSAALPPSNALFLTPQSTIGLQNVSLKRTAEQQQPQQLSSAEESQDAKKVKLDLTPSEQSQPSRVVHFRSVPADATELDIVQLGIPFGRMTNLVLAKKKNQALLEMDEVQSAQALLEYYSERQPTVRGRPVYVQYSNHQHLKTEQEGQSPEAVSPVTSQADDRTVLRVIVDNMLYPVSIDVLKQIFSRYGAVLKIVTFSKNNFPDQLQALIQMSEPMAAQTAKFSLNGQNIYGGCCTLRIDFSKLTSLNVKYNNDKSRDYTNPTLPSGDSTATPLTIDQIGSPYRSNPAAPGATTFISPFAPSPAIPFIGPSSLPGLSLPGTTLRFPSISSSPAINSVVLVSNLNEETVTPDALFTLFGVYGDVIRVKVLFNKKDNALVQYNDPSGAQFAIQHLNNIRVWGKPLKVTQSKHAVVQMPREGQQDAQLTKDYTSSSLHRFKKPNSKNHHNIYPPSATLHLSNIPPNVGEQTLRDLFGEFGTIVNFKFFSADRDRKDRKMALMQMDGIEEAVHALINLHNHQLAEAAHLRVSFSKSYVVPQSQALANGEEGEERVLDENEED